MILAIDLGGTKIKIALVHEEKITDFVSIDANSKLGFKANIPRLNESINILLDKNHLLRHDLLGIGLATPGVVDSENTTVLGINGKYTDLVGFDLKSWAGDLPIAVENDAKAALLGEWKYGVGRGVENLVGVTLGTGIGTAAIVDGRMLKGKNSTAGNLGGHLILDYKGLECNCGNIGCVEAHSSSWALPSIIKNHPNYESSMLKGNALDFGSLFTIENDSLVKEIREHCLEIWATGIKNLCFAYDPELVILNGGIMASGDKIIPVIENKINQKNKLRPESHIKVKMAEYLDTAALFGLKYLLESNRS